jgi:translocation and assembly module TamA
VTLGPAAFPSATTWRRLFAATAAAALLASSATSPALAFKLFGHRFFEPHDNETAVVPDAQPYTLDFTVAGADKDLTKAIEGASSLSRDIKRPPPGTPGLVARARGDYGRILAALYTTGHYGGTIQITVQGQPVETMRPDVELPDPVPVSVAVDPGPLFHFGTITVQGLPNEPITSEDKQALKLWDWEFKQGADARSGLILDTEGRLIEVWRQRGHPKARVTRNIVANHDTDLLDVTLNVEPGPAARLGVVQVTPTPNMDTGFVRWATGIKPGEPYDPDTLRQARARLQHLGVYSSVAVVEGDTVGPDGILPITFNLSERKRHVIGGGASYSTLDGGTLQAYWMHRNLFGHAESLRIDAAVSQIGSQDLGGMNYSLATTFRRPAIFTPDTDMTLQIFGKRENIVDEYDTTNFGAKAGLEHRFTEKLTGTTALNVEKIYAEEEVFGDNQYLIVSLPSTLDYDGRDDKLDPTHGIHGTLEAEPMVDVEGGTVALIAQSSLSSYYALDDRRRMVIAARGAIGTIVGASLPDIPPDRRFYLGGGGSIRGYDYRSVGPKIDGNVVGGLSFWDSSLEFRYRVTNTIGIVPFVDAGAAYEDSLPDFSEGVQVGAGIGLRYYTSLGPIRLDVAVPINPRDDEPSVAFYVGLGQAF